MGSSVRIARIAGVDIRIHVSWLVIALLIGWTFFARFRFLYDELGTGEAVALAVAAAIIFFVSILVHELSHSLMARARGMEVRSITLFLFGGATDADVQSRGPSAELQVALVGPATSLVIAGLLWGATSAVPGEAVEIGGMLAYLAWLNLALAVFNLLPGFPLDGGRVLRAGIWRVTGNLRKATDIAGTVGRVVGYGLMGLGLVLFATGDGGLWLVLIGWFLSQAAQVEARQQQEDVTAAEKPAAPRHR